MLFMGLKINPILKIVLFVDCSLSNDHETHMQATWDFPLAISED